MQAIHGNPHYRPQPEQADSVRQPIPTHPGRPAKAATAGRAVVDQVELSATAQELASPAGPGKSGNSPAHRARGAIEAHPELAGLPFGQVVKAINHGTVDSLIAPAEPEAEDTPAPEGAEQAAPAVETTETAETDEVLTGLVDEVVADTGSDDPAAPESAPEPIEASTDETTGGLAISTQDGVDVADELLAALDAAADEEIIDNSI